MAPSQQEIASIFEKIRADGGDFLNHLDPDVKLEVMGHDHATRKVHKSHQAMTEEIFAQFAFLDGNSFKSEPRQVIGGGSSPWASVELILTGKSQKGKAFNHECVCIVHFNEGGKIDEARAYFDSSHLDDHFTHHRQG
ncbi:hypothetical protein PRZ48_009065 [Zasmidium cellare]|uniref:SnoaL-like domain-containing protein n=1 Tax=Zasmidium cellare TaxID=395010 RepID=A0ABR0EIF7_ZASCE|nr:hypothetical protein PRZ48_009065 [Zasmidium cellare]